MSKFPLLDTYRTLAVILAVIVVIAGFFAALSAATAFEQAFNVGTFIVAWLPFLGGAFSLGVFAELIQLFLNIEDHLEHIKIASERQGVQLTRALENTAATSSSRPTSSGGSTSSTQTRASSQPAIEIFARVQAKATTSVCTKPETAFASGQLNSGQTITVYGRNSDSTWLSIGRTGKLWIDAADVQVVEGDVGRLPIVQPVE